ncbi:FkbM family methyltransferase [Streptomyces sp. N50]|uniref:FkbM family methyltransferase n=1 Tax=Streptomyces sp. N50 TaxID=3081765 RepID=UPI0029620B11|nr:FkbM family methyltransferase [Streptomyces sp. N50]WOX15484.1 FkbM family methyltransferase [Streptomyces sp. N50]
MTPRRSGSGHDGWSGGALAPSAWRASGAAAALTWSARRMTWVEDEVAGVAEFVRPGDVCLDIGAEYGLYTWVLSALVGPSGRVHSVEPLPGPARWLRAASRVLGSGNVTVHRNALGARAGHGELSLPRRWGLPVHGRAYLVEGTDGPGPNAEFSTARSVPAPVRTLDELVRSEGIEKVGFVKADVEGAESGVLDGAHQTLLTHRPPLLLEVEDRHLRKYGARPRDVLRRLQTYGYRPHRWRAGRWVDVPQVGDDCRNYLFTI